MSSSTPAVRFLLDENIRVELDRFLRDQGRDARRLSKGAPDRSLAAASKAERRVIVTSDEDFASAAAGTVFAVILLRIPQRDVHHLLAVFAQVLEECRTWEAQLIVLTVNGWRSSALAAKRPKKKRAA